MCVDGWKFVDNARDLTNDEIYMDEIQHVGVGVTVSPDHLLSFSMNVIFLKGCNTIHLGPINPVTSP